MIHAENGCPFCSIDEKRIIDENELGVAILDLYPVSELHTLIIPKRHAETYFDLFAEEVEALHELLCSRKVKITEEDELVEGFNIGFNCGKSAGQTVMHCHMHLIPRRSGDLENPTGGIRNIFPGMGDYLSD